MHNDYASVQKQSGIRAGEGGFQVNVASHTDLKGGVIISNERAIEEGRNSLATETLSFSDIENRDSSKASGISLGVNVGKNQSGNTFSPSMAPGMGKVSDSQSSTTRNGISIAALTLGDKQAANIFKNGMDVYAISPKAGVTPNVFVSNVAGTKEGGITLQGGAQQVIIPNRSLWTAPTPVDLVTLRPIGGK